MELGWETTHATKYTSLNNLRSAVEDSSLAIADERILREIRSFTHSDAVGTIVRLFVFLPVSGATSISITFPAHPTSTSPPTIPRRGSGTRPHRPHREHHTAGHFWMTLLEGEHISSDVALVDGEPMWWEMVSAHVFSWCSQ
jgi:hypothetical protein